MHVPYCCVIRHLKKKNRQLLCTLKPLNSPHKNEKEQDA